MGTTGFQGRRQADIPTALEGHRTKDDKFPIHERKSELFLTGTTGKVFQGQMWKTTMLALLSAQDVVRQ